MCTADAATTALTPKQIAGRLGISERSVREKVYSGLWPHRRLDKRTLRFTESDYEEILAMARRVQTTTQMKSASVDQTKHELVALLTSRRAA
jgi:predicted site-specific integrase-resolvase